MKLVILARNQENTNYVYHYLAQNFDVIGVIIEDPVHKSVLLKNRIKKLGLIKTLGQILFMVVIKLLLQMRLISTEKRLRLSQLKESSEFNDEEIPKDKVIRVQSVNDSSVLKKIKEWAPDLIVVNGTRIIKANVIKESPLMLNIHTGITPQYRGVHGGYWALVQNDRKNCGVTIHQVDAGVDTGQVCGQALIDPGVNDWFLTYPLLQYQNALPLLTEVIKKIAKGEKPSIARQGYESQQYYHPSLFEYLLNGLFKKVW